MGKYSDDGLSKNHSFFAERLGNPQSEWRISVTSRMCKITNLDIFFVL